MVVKHPSHRTSKKIKPKNFKRTELTKKITLQRGASSSKKIAGGRDAKTEKQRIQIEGKTFASSTRPIEEVVTYAEPEFSLTEISPKGTHVMIGPENITRFEKARITGARSLQLSLGAPSFIVVPQHIRDSVSLATAELLARTLPISIRRVLPNGLYQDIPIDWLK